MFAEDVLAEALANNAYRREITTGPNSQIVVMAIPEGTDIGAEVHPHTDQIFLVAAGTAWAEVGGQEQAVMPGDVVYVPQGTEHDLVNTGGEVLKLVTVYAPPHHKPGTLQQTKADAAGEKTY